MAMATCARPTSTATPLRSSWSSPATAAISTASTTRCWTARACIWTSRLQVTCSLRRGKSPSRRTASASSFRANLKTREPRFGLVAGDLYTRRFDVIKAPTADRSYISPVFSPTGRLLAFIDRRRDADANWTSRLVIALPSGRQETVIYETRREVAWSPTGEWLALVADGHLRLRPVGGATRPADRPPRRREPLVARWRANQHVAAGGSS